RHPGANLNRHFGGFGVAFRHRRQRQGPGRRRLRDRPRSRLTRSSVMPIVPLLANSSFDPEAVEVLSAAFDDGRAKPKQTGRPVTRPAYERGAREVLAKCIIEMAQRGERDRRQLTEAAVTYLTDNYKG